MRRRLVIIVSTLLLLTGVGSAVLVAQDIEHGRKFASYWMGIDPLDGGDSRRGITRNDDRTFSVIGRDTTFTLCDGTGRAIVTLRDGTIVGSALVSDNFLITCFGEIDHLSQLEEIYPRSWLQSREREKRKADIESELHRCMSQRMAQVDMGELGEALWNRLSDWRGLLKRQNGVA